MAYRFNPPPNWPIDDPSWTPPPGWQPDPSWGPAPEGWNFWIAAEDAPSPTPIDESAAAPSGEPAAASSDVPAAASSDAPAAEPVDAAAAGPVAQPSDEQQGAEHSGAAAGGPDLEHTHVAQQPEQPVTTDAAAEQQGATGLGQDQDSTAQTDSTGQYGALNPYGPAPTTDAAADAQSSPAPEAQAPAPQASAPAPAQQPAAPEQEAAPVAGTGGTAQGGPETAEYAGPDREADLAQQAPYETAAPAAPAYGQPQSGADATYDQQQAGAAPAYDQQQAAATQGYDQASSADQGGSQGYGQGSPTQGYGQASPAQGYGQASPADRGAQGYDQSAPAAGYDQSTPAAGYDQSAPAGGYGQASPAPGYGQGSPADYSTQGYGQGSPSGDPGAAWPASTGAEPPKKGIFQRFWWVGCIILLVLVLVVAIIGGVMLLNRSGDEPTSGGTTTTQEETTDGEQTTDEETTDDEATEPQPTPTDLATIDASAEEVDIVGRDGAGTMAVHMTYTPAEDLETDYGEPVQAGEQGDYLVVTAKLTVTEGTFEGLNPYQFAVKTPYGGAVDPASPSYSLKGSGAGFTPENGFSAGDEYTMTLLFDVKKADGNTLEFDSRADTYSWDVPA
jgi:hypothetical protein